MKLWRALSGRAWLGRGPCWCLVREGQGDRQTDDPINGNCDGSLSACMTAVTLFEGCLQDFMTWHGRHKITDERERKKKKRKKEKRKKAVLHRVWKASSALVVALKPFNRDIARHTPNSDYWNVLLFMTEFNRPKVRPCAENRMFKTSCWLVW